MGLRVELLEPGKSSGDTLVLTAWAKGINDLDNWPGLPVQLLNSLWASGKVKGNLEELGVVFCGRRSPWQQVLILGMGEEQKFTVEAARLCGAALARGLRKVKAKETVISLGMKNGVTFTAEGLLQGILLGDYSFQRYKQEKLGRPALNVVFAVTKDYLTETAGLVRDNEILVRRVNYVRDLVNEPGNILTPSELAKQAQRLALECGLGCEVLGPRDIRELNMGGLLGVAKGSAEEPRLIVLIYNGNQSDKTGKKLGLVGKGVTFDAGGISLKSVDGMLGEKCDMAGGAAVMGAMAAIAELKLPINAIGIIPSAENLPGGNALKPDDVLTMLDGTTVEIISTDAEGRLILADAIAYAKKLKSDPIVDIATLTAHCSLALGPFYAGLWSNNKGLQEQILEASAKTGEKIWPMPYDEGFYERTKGVVADLKNSGGREGGANSAAAFLGHFAGAMPWAHIDIAPTAFADRGTGYIKRGGTGFGVRTLVGLAQKLATK